MAIEQHGDAKLQGVSIRNRILNSLNGANRP